MPTVFVSYARANASIVRALVDELRELGYEAMFDQNLTGGQRWWDVLLDQIHDADGFLPVLSHDYRRSEACHREAEWAAALNIPFIPIDLGEIGPELCDPIVAESNWVRYRLDERASVARLARALAAMSATERPSPLPDRPAIPISYYSEIEREVRSAPSVPIEQQLLIITRMRSRLGTREDASARLILSELRARDDVTYANAVEIDELLRQPSVEPDVEAVAPPPAERAEPVVPLVEPVAPPAEPVAPPAEPVAPPTEPVAPPTEPRQPPATPPPAAAAESSPQPPARPARTRSDIGLQAALWLWLVAVVMLVSSLVWLRWGGRTNQQFSFSDLHNQLHFSATPTLSKAFFGWMAYTTFAISAASTLAALLVRSNAVAWRVGAAAVTVLTIVLTAVSCATLGSHEKSEGETGVGPGPGLVFAGLGLIVLLACIALRLISERERPAEPVTT